MHQHELIQHHQPYTKITDHDIHIMFLHLFNEMVIIGKIISIMLICGEEVEMIQHEIGEE